MVLSSARADTAAKMTAQTMAQPMLYAVELPGRLTVFLQGRRLYLLPAQAVRRDFIAVNR